MKSPIETIKTSFDNLSVAEAIGKKKRILITENAKYKLEALLDDKNECDSFFVRQTVPDLNDMTTMSWREYGPDQFRQACEHIQK